MILIMTHKHHLKKSGWKVSGGSGVLILRDKCLMYKYRVPTPQGNLENSLNFANSVKEFEIPWNFIKLHKYPWKLLEICKDWLLCHLSPYCDRGPHSKQSFTMVKNAHKVVEVNKNHVLLMHELLLIYLFHTPFNFKVIPFLKRLVLDFW